MLVRARPGAKAFPPATWANRDYSLAGYDAVLADAAVDRRAGHAERAGRADLVAALVEQGLNDRVPFDRLKRRQHPARDRPALGRQVLRQDLADPAALYHLLEHLPELGRVPRPGGPLQQLHRGGRAGDTALLAELAEEERDQVAQVLAVVTQRRHGQRPGEQPQQAAQVGPGGAA